MVEVEGALEIRVLHRHGKSIREIARETGIARNTVRRYLRDEEAARYKPRPPRSTKLDPFKAYVAERLSSAAPEWIPASVLLMELRERGLSRNPPGAFDSPAGPTGPQATMPSGGPKISCATSGSRKAATIEQPFACSTHHAVLASWLAICSTT